MIEIGEDGRPARAGGETHVNGEVKFPRKRAGAGPSTTLSIALVVLGLVVWAFAIYGVVKLVKGNKP